MENDEINNIGYNLELLSNSILFYVFYHVVLIFVIYIIASIATLAICIVIVAVGLSFRKIKKTISSLFHKPINHNYHHSYHIRLY